MPIFNHINESKKTETYQGMPEFHWCVYILGVKNSVAELCSSHPYASSNLEDYTKVQAKMQLEENNYKYAQTRKPM
jgi:hypothetical protein